mmetsp:Transcript_32259/g.79645  ORF Transcript_32259/g.79645 Transcript_32259/m.79645 type:complete len:292 (+) Transcript_32259:463-1338(+)
MMTAAAPAASTTSASCCAPSTEDPAPRRIFTVSGSGTPSAMPRTRRSSLAGFFSSAAPRPRFHVSWMGHPQLRSMKSAPASAAMRPAAIPSAIWFVAICTPNSFSDGWRRSRAFSTGLPRVTKRANTISDTVTLQPKSTHSRRNGRLPPLVSGARNSCPRMLSRNASTAASVTLRDVGSPSSRPKGETSCRDLRPSTCGALAGAGGAFVSTTMSTPPAAALCSAAAAAAAAAALAPSVAVNASASACTDITPQPLLLEFMLVAAAAGREVRRAGAARGSAIASVIGPLRPD